MGLYTYRCNNRVEIMNDKISIAMAVCNGERFIAEQLDSIMQQTCIPCEIIICDDSCDDKTYAKIAPFEDKYPEIIKYFHNKQNLGVSKNFERAISLTTGDIIFLSDQDDVWASDKIQNAKSIIDNNLPPIGVFCDSTIVDQNLRSLGYTHWGYRDFSASQFSNINKVEKLAIFTQRVSAAGHNMAFSKEFKNIILPFPDLVACHDTWIGLVIASTSEWFLIDAELTKYRQHQFNVSQISKNCQFKQAMYSIKNNTFAWYTELYDELIRRISLIDSIQPEVLELLKDRRNHSAIRAAMDCNIFKRLPLIYGEVNNKRYFKYGRGWKSVIQDLVLRNFI